MKECCGNCHYATSWASDMIVCRRYPPQVVPRVWQIDLDVETDSDRHISDADLDTYDQPILSPTRWCGEWKADNKCLE